VGSNAAGIAVDMEALSAHIGTVGFSPSPSGVVPHEQRGPEDNRGNRRSIHAGSFISPLRRSMRLSSSGAVGRRDMEAPTFPRPEEVLGLDRTRRTEMMCL
jgi:hypothetical protein